MQTGGGGGVPLPSLSSSETARHEHGGLGGPAAVRGLLPAYSYSSDAWSKATYLRLASLAMVVGLHILHGLPIQSLLTLPHRQICRPRLVICFSFLYTGSC